MTTLLIIIYQSNFIEGDHITVTASKYPFPTVCANNQSTDWFSAISRTLNWNQRERQKSFVMVEESTKKKPSRRRSTTPRKMEAVSEVGREDEIDEEDEDEEEDDKFDIDDLSGTDTEAKAEPVKPQPISEAERDWEQHNAEAAAEALSKVNPNLSRIAFSKSGLESGVDSPDRFMGPLPHPPKVSPRHVQWTKGEAPGPTASGDSEPGSAGLRPHPQLRERLARDRAETGDTPKPTTLVHGHFNRGTVISNHRGRSKSKDVDGVERRTFAVWGHDESDSNCSDNDS